MPLSQVGQVLREQLFAFRGVNLRRESLSLADEDVLRSINADLHRTPGVIRLRQGRTAQSSTNFSSAIRTLARHGSTRYRVAGTTVYRNTTNILTGLSSTLVTSLIPFRPLNDTTTWSFIADQGLMRKDNGTTVHIWGIVAPDTTPTLAVGAAGSLTGNYRARYTYVRIVGSSVAHESNPCPAPSAVALSSQQLSVPVVASLDPQVTHIRVYRTVAGGSAYLYDQQVANTTATIASSQADTALGASLETDNDVPPLAAWATEFQGHAFLCLDPSNPHYLWYSKRFRPESWPTDQFLELGNPHDPLQCAIATTGLLGVFSRETKYRVLGNAVSGFVGLEALNTRGTPAPNAVVLTSRGTCFVARDGLFLTNFVEPDVEISQAIQALFYGETINEMAPIDWDQSASLTLAEYKRRLYFGYQDINGKRMLAIYSLDTQAWYHYEHPVHRLLVEEQDDALVMGGSDGQAWVLESGTTDDGAAIALEVDLPQRSLGDRFRQKRYGWAGFDVDAAGGTWYADILQDTSTTQTIAIQGSRERRYIRLVSETEGRLWQVKLRYTGSGDAACYGVEVWEEDGQTGQVWVEHPTATGQYVQLLPGGQSDLFTRQRYEWIKFDAATGPGTWTVQVFIDETLRHTTTFTGARNRQLQRLPDRCLGFVWRAVVRYSTTPVPPVYGVQLQGTPLRPR